jgi:hypothetical protein
MDISRKFVFKVTLLEYVLDTLRKFAPDTKNPQEGLCSEPLVDLLPSKSQLNYTVSIDSS